MTNRILGVLVLVVLLTAVWLTLPVRTTSAQDASGADVRMAARANADGSISVGLQYQLDGRWRPVQPTRNVLPATAGLGRWHVTNAADIEVAQAQVQIGVLNRDWSHENGPDQFTVAVGDTRFRARCGRLNLQLTADGLTMRSGTRNCEDSVIFAEQQLANPVDVGLIPVRIASRRVANGIEMGIQRLRGDQWEAIHQPSNPLLSDLSQGRWRFTEAFDLPVQPAFVSAQLRRGATFTTRDGEFDIEVDGRTYRTRCGTLDLDILTKNILLDTLAAGCNEAVSLLTICPTSDCDEQQNQAYAWESRQIGSTLDRIELTLPQARDVVNALFADYFPRLSPPQVTFSDEQGHGHASRDAIVLGTKTRNLGSLLHELAHTFVRRASSRANGHNGVFTAMLLDIWARYFPIADVNLARADARRHGIEVASKPPVQAANGHAIETLNELLCGPRPISAALCLSHTGAMFGVAGESIAGLYVGSGGHGDNLSWFAYIEDTNRTFKSYVVKQTPLSSHPAQQLKLQIECSGHLEVQLWWSDISSLPTDLEWRLGDGEWRRERWITGSGTWGDGFTSYHEAPDPVGMVTALMLADTAEQDVAFRFTSSSRIYTAAFDLAGVFETPVQRNLLQCATVTLATDPGGRHVGSR